MKRRSVLFISVLAAVLWFTFAHAAQALQSENLLGGGAMIDPGSTGIAAEAADSNTYAQGTRAINDGRWADAVASFSQVANQAGEHADGALYWKAYAQNKLGQSNAALETCGALRRDHPASKWIEECGALEIEIHAASGQPVQPKAQQSDDLKLLALATLMQRNEKRALADIDEILRSSDSSEKLKQGALFILSEHHTVLNGTWVNVNPGTRGLAQIVIDGLNIHPFGACHPYLCDWGIVQGRSFAAGADSRDAAAIMAQVITSFSETTLTLARDTDEQLRCDAFTHFTDNSNRADYHSTDYFMRDVRPAPVAAQPPQPAAQTPVSPDRNQTLVVWKAGSPASNETPDSQVPLNLERKAESMGLRLQVRAFAGIEFAQEFRNAFAAHQEPDIIAIENAASIHGGGPYNPGVGIASDPDVRKSLIQVNGSLQDLAGPRGGWQYLISTSQHAEAARRLALRAPDCDVLYVPQTPVPPEIQKAALEIANAYLRTPTEMKNYNDADRLTTEGVRWDSVNARETKTCSVWGNDRLAFVSLVSTFEHEDFDKQPPPRSLAHGPLIGQMPILLVLRKQGAGWRLLAASSNPMRNNDFLFQFPAISRLLREPAVEESGVAPAQLLSPENGHAPVREAGQRFGNFTWQPSPSGNVVTQIVEFAYQNDDWLYFMPTHNDATPDQWSAGSVSTAAGEWKWRVWSISDTGAIAFSDYRTFRQ
jgi:hypothetical protein